MPSATPIMRPLERAAAQLIRGLDAVLHRLYGWRWNPLHQSGALAAWLLLVLTVTGLYLLLFYRVGAPAESVARIAADPWLGAWMRSLHRYATDAFVIAAALHAMRLLGQAREWGPRTRAWVTGVFLMGVGLGAAWTGFVMAWDSFGLRLALAGATLFDALPFLSEPVSRIFTADVAPPSAFFFINLFAHIALPLAMGVLLWLHVSRVARAILLPPRALRWAITAILFVFSVLVPARLGPAATPLLLPANTPLDLPTAFWLPFAEWAPPLVTWTLVAMAFLGALLIPRLGRRARVGSWSPSVVDPRLCTGCDQCTQDCPWEAIAMGPRADDRPTLVATVDPSRCVSCGICAGSCKPMGVGPPGRTGRDQLALLDLVGEGPSLRALDDRVVVVHCALASASARERLTAAGARLHEVPCVGALHSSVVERLIRRGASGVMVAACPPRDCVGREGPKWLEQRFFHDREAELQPRVDRQRVAVETLAVGLEGEIVSAFVSFQARLRARGSDVAALDEESPPVCEPADSAVAS